MDTTITVTAVNLQGERNMQASFWAFPKRAENYKHEIFGKRHISAGGSGGLQRSGVSDAHRTDMSDFLNYPSVKN